MPMVWDAAADAKLLAKIFEICEVTVKEPQKHQLATIMGCTPKAITHRIAKIKAGNASGDGAEKLKRAPAAKRVAIQTVGGKGKKRSLTPDEDHEEGEGKGVLIPPPSGRGDKKRKNKQEPSEDGIEPGEDIGEGLRKGAGARGIEEESGDEMV